MKFLAFFGIFISILFAVPLLLFPPYGRNEVVVTAKNIEFVVNEENGVLDVEDKVFILHLKRNYEKKTVIVTEDFYNSVSVLQNMTNSNIW